MADPCSVKVAVRIRPLIASEIAKGSKECIDVIPENEQIIVRTWDKNDKAFTYNYVFGANSRQEELYECCVKTMLPNLFKGYNCTIFAYGQTGSGKTHSMGTAYKGEGHMGVIPRAIKEIFDFVNDNFSIDFTITVSFTELYQEVLYDLLSERPREQCILEIREDVSKGGIHIPGLTEVQVNSSDEVLNTLRRGSCGRVTAATAMNAQSSRSHAIFTITVAMYHKTNIEENKVAKLHLVDLAGSERPKKTGASGNTFKEGININKGLFVLGNVISALGDEKQQCGHIPYRDSNLTRLLKDSLGGNSITLMIACISPADYNLEETLSTLRYADRARKIKNKPIVNQDSKTAQINELKKTIQQLRLQIIGQGGALICPVEVEALKKEINEYKLKIRDLSNKLSVSLIDKTGLHEKILILQHANEQLIKKFEGLKNQFNVTLINLSTGLQNNDEDYIKENISKLQDIEIQFNDINAEQKKATEEIRDHEAAFSNIINAANNTEVREIQEKQEIYTNKQVALNTELEGIIKELIIKEQLAEHLETNAKYMIDYDAMADTEQKINTLQKEKDELLQQLKNVKNQETSTKSAEQRRKRVQELESQIYDLKKKVQEQSRLIKLKEKDEQRIKQLNHEIIEMKKLKVKLIKSMREESDKFRQWKMQQNKELTKIREQDRKKATEIANLKIMHQKQQNVFKRKVEEAAALNKRLKDALALRKQVQSNKASGQAERIGPWLKHEFNVFVNLVEAEATLSGLLEDRGTLQQQLDALKENPDSNEAEIKSLEEDIELRSAQILDLQQKLLDSEEDKSKIRWDNVQTMAEAKFALKMIFEQVADIQKEKVLTNMKINELQDINNDLSETVKKLELMNISQEQKYVDQIAELNNAYEEKVNILLKQLRGVSIGSGNEQFQQRLAIQEEEIDKHERSIINLKQENINLQHKNQGLIEQIRQLQESLTSDTNKSDLLEVKEMSDPLTPKNFNITNRKKNAPADTELNGTFTVAEKENVENVSDTSFEDDYEKDPDWRKTPLGKRVLMDRIRLSHIRGPDKESEKIVLKRSSEGGCTCKTNCGPRCGCRRLTRKCNSSCKCSSSTCKNKEDENCVVSTTSDISGEFESSATSNTSNNSGDEEAFKKPRSFQRKRPKKLFSLN